MSYEGLSEGERQTAQSSMMDVQNGCPAQAVKRIYIIHGYAASPAHHWFPWLADKLAAEGHQVHILPMPNADNPDAQRWIQFLEEQVQDPDENTFFVAHSLGCISLLRHLAVQEFTGQIGGLVLVSGFAEPLPSLPMLDPFTEHSIDAGKIIKMTPYRSVISARNDEIVPYELSNRLSQMLQATFHGLYEGGHFLDSDGYTELPVVYRELAAMLQAA